MSSFEGLSVALSALYAQRRGLDVTGQNIANANTDGYTRQRVTLQSVGAPSVPAMWSQSTIAGSGVEVTGIQRLRDAFLEAQGQLGHAELSDLTASHDVVSTIEQLFPEPSDTGLQSHLSDLWNSFHDVANQPDSLSARAQTLQRATIVTDWLNQTANQLTSLSSARTGELSTIVAQVNQTAQRVADLNQAILQGTQAGLPVNELMDQRDQLAMQLAESVGGVTRSDPDGTLGVYVSGASLVRSNRAETIQMATVAGTLQLQWARDGSTVQVTSGRANALLDAVNNVVPGWMSQLDAVAASLAGQVNAAQAAGYDLNGAPGTAMFSGTTASTISVALTDPKTIAASSVAPVAGAVSLDSGNADALAGIGSSPTSPDSVYHQLIVNLGIVSQNLGQRVDTQNAIVTNVDGARESQSGVSLDEEMTNMLQYQHAYEAASRVVTAVDQTLDTLINRTGLVGR